MASEKEEEKEKNKNGEKEKEEKERTTFEEERGKGKEDGGMKYCHRSNSLLKLSPSAANSHSLAF